MVYLLCLDFVLTDLCVALVMKQISFKAGLKTLIIALFLILEVKVASIISNCLL